MSKMKEGRLKLKKEDLIKHLREQITFLIRSAEAYDRGDIFEAKRIAHSIRLLLHDTRASKSLLGQLGLKEKRFYDTAGKFNPKNLAGHAGLLSFRFNNPEGCRPWVVARGNREDVPKKRYSDWWSETVIATPPKIKRICFSRMDIILNVADTDGGSHVDDSIEIEYAALARWNALGISTRQNGIVEPIDNPILPCIRQIAHEVLILLTEKHPELFWIDYACNAVGKSVGADKCTGVPTKSELIFGDI